MQVPRLQTSRTIESSIEDEEGVAMIRMGLVGLVALGCLAAARGQTASEKKATVGYLQGFQSKGGGFVAPHPQPTEARKVRPSLRATTAGVRALAYFGGAVPDPKAAARFVQACFRKADGSFVDEPESARPDVVTTAVGLMAVVELKMSPEAYAGPAVKYLSRQARSFEDIRMAAAGLEAIRQKSPRAGDWLKQVSALRTGDGTYGKGMGAARLTGSAVVTVLRLGGKVEQRDRVLKVLRAGQRGDGGFGKEDAAGSDLETCYRVMRAFAMLKEKPANAEALRRFVSRCRNADGGYGLAPGQPSTITATYFAGAVLHWLAG
jgi:prenyltransferase beta subunit